LSLAFSEQEIVRNCLGGGLLGSILSLGFGDGLCFCGGLLSGGFCLCLEDGF